MRHCFREIVSWVNDWQGRINADKIKRSRYLFMGTIIRFSGELFSNLMKKMNPLVIVEK